MRRRENRWARWKSGLRSNTSVNLISMMDILTVLLLFLLKSYVADGEVMVPPEGVRLPASTAQQSPQTSLIVAIDGTNISVGNEAIISIADAVNTDGLLIAPLAAKLEQERQTLEAYAASRGLQAPAVRAATIQGDRDIEFRLLQKIMFTLSSAGYESIALAVLQNT